MKRVLVFVCAVATEAISWSGILVSGLGWIFTSRSVHDLIRSTVCIMFVQNVDEVVYESCCPADIKNDVESTKYRSISYLQNLGMSDSASKRVGSIYVSFCHLPTFFFACVTAVFVVSSLDHVKAQCPQQSLGMGLSYR